MRSWVSEWGNTFITLMINKKVVFRMHKEFLDIDKIWVRMRDMKKPHPANLSREKEIVKTKA